MGAEWDQFRLSYWVAVILLGLVGCSNFKALHMPVWLLNRKLHVSHADLCMGLLECILYMVADADCPHESVLCGAEVTPYPFNNMVWFMHGDPIRS